MSSLPPAGADADRWRRLETRVDRALALGPPERAAFLAQECGEDLALRREVETLLARERSADAFPERPIQEVAGRLLADAPARNFTGVPAR